MCIVLSNSYLMNNEDTDAFILFIVLAHDFSRIATCFGNASMSPKNNREKKQIFTCQSY